MHVRNEKAKKNAVSCVGPYNV